MSREGLSPWWIAAALVAVSLGSIAAWYWFVQQAPPALNRDQMVGAGSAADEAEPNAVPVSTPPPEPELPPLAASDAFVREMAQQLSDHPQVAEWLVPEDLVRRLVASVDNIARGDSPQPHLGHMAPAGKFRIEPRIEGATIDPKTYQRYDLLTEVFTSLDIGASVRLYYDLEPLLEEAYRELGDPSRTFGESLDLAIERLISTPIPEGEVDVEKHLLVYRFKDPRFEALTPAEKHLVRLGPENAAKVKGKLTFLRSALDLGRKSQELLQQQPAEPATDNPANGG